MEEGGEQGWSMEGLVGEQGQTMEGGKGERRNRKRAPWSLSHSTGSGLGSSYCHPNGRVMVL